MSRLDLHLHSTCSDGTLPPEQVVRLAADSGAELIALTDHDTLSGVAQAQQAGRALGLSVIAGVEIGVQDPALGELHVLGYFPPDAPLTELERQLTEYRDERLTRAQRTLSRLQELNVPVELTRVMQIAGEAPIGRPHIARAMVEAGHVESVADAFNRILHNDGPAFVPRLLLSLQDSVSMIHAADGFASLAHPSRYDAPEEATRTFAAANGDGLEVYYRRDSDETIALGESLARELNLAPTTGSDYHGLHPNEVLPGAVTVPESGVGQLNLVYQLLRDFAS